MLVSHMSRQDDTALLQPTVRSSYASVCLGRKRAQRVPPRTSCHRFFFLARLARLVRAYFVPNERSAFPLY
jgi:hypothetical protein